MNLLKTAKDLNATAKKVRVWKATGKRVTPTERGMMFTGNWKHWQPKRKQVEKYAAVKTAAYQAELRKGPEKRRQANIAERLQRHIRIQERKNPTKPTKPVFED